MVEHAQIIDTELLHEPKGIQESVDGEVYISDNDDENTNPTGHWGKLPITSLDFTAPQTVTQTYTSPTSPVTLTNTIVGTASGTITPSTNFTQANQNFLELYTAIDNLMTRLVTAESNLSKVQTLLTDIDAGLKSIDILAEEE